MMTDCPIFVIENDAATRNFMQDILSDEGYVVHCCAWPAATVEAVVQMQARLVIMDLNPIEPGRIVPFLTHLRQYDTVRNVHVLVNSTSAHLLSNLDEPLQHFACQTMLKPFELDDFLSHVTNLCAGRLPEVAAA